LGQEEPEFHLASPFWTRLLLTLRSLIRLRGQCLNEPVSTKTRTVNPSRVATSAVWPRRLLPTANSSPYLIGSRTRLCWPGSSRTRTLTEERNLAANPTRHDFSSPMDLLLT